MKTSKELEIQIDGGLGNQLFQFYAGLYFAEYFNLNPIFEISRLRRISKLHPGLNIFSLGILDEFKTKSNSNALLKRFNYKARSYVSNLIQSEKTSLLKANGTTEFYEIGYVEIDKLVKVRNSIPGYFQTWRYFDALQVKPLITIERLGNPTDWLNQNLKRMQEVNPLVIHVRRGDYKLDKNRDIGCLSVEYFESVCGLHTESDEIWIVTDSPEKTHNEFKKFSKKTIVLDPPSNSDPVESMILMSKAKSIAISNSTFSWWAAKLSAPDSNVYAPAKWFQNRPDPTDLIPESWRKVESDWVEH